MNYKTKEAATAAVSEYGSRGVVFQYEKSGRWNWATVGSGIWHDIVATLVHRTGEAVINPKAAPMYRLPVRNVKFGRYN